MLWTVYFCFAFVCAQTSDSEGLVKEERVPKKTQGHLLKACQRHTVSQQFRDRPHASAERTHYQRGGPDS